MHRISVVGWCVVAMLQISAVGRAQQEGEVKLELLRTLSVDGGAITAAAFAHDGKALATANFLGELRVLDMPVQTVRWRAQPSDHWVGYLEFSADGTRLACCGRHLTVHDALTGKVLFRSEHAGPSGFAWHPDGKRFAYANGTAVYLSGNKMDVPWASFEYPARHLSFADDESLFVGDNVGRLWHVAVGSRITELRHDPREHGYRGASSLAVVCAGGKVFDLASKCALRCDDAVIDYPGEYGPLAVTKDARSFAAGSSNKLVRWWTESGDTFRDVKLDDHVRALAFHPDGETLFISTRAGSPALYAADKQPIAVATMHARLKELRMSPDGTILALKTSGWALYATAGGAPKQLPNAQYVTPGRRGSELLVQERERLVVLEARSNTELAVLPSKSYLNENGGTGPGDLLLVGDALVDIKGEKVTEMPYDVLMHLYATVAHASDGSWAVGGGSGFEGDLGGLVVTDKHGKLRGFLDDGPVYTLAFSPDSTRIYYGC
ncbi:MAG TPA: hypothetical protein EYP98_16820, partial [Planctomycetes bacterium]|nr:hypothetical protein [Planctomycetota bacterium]